MSIAGPLRIGSFADLSVEASDVDLKSTAGKGPLRIVRARSVTAVIRLSSLLRGKLDFRKFVIDVPARRVSPWVNRTASVVIRAWRRTSGLGPFGQKPIRRRRITRSRVFLQRERKRGLRASRVEPGETGQGRRLLCFDGCVCQERPGSGKTLFTLWISQAAGLRRPSEANAPEHVRRPSESLRLRADLGTAGGDAILAAVAPWERPDAIAVSGELHLSRTRAALDDAAISFGDHDAKGFSRP